MTDENENDTDDDREFDHEPAGPDRDPESYDITKDGFGRFSYAEKPGHLLDDEGGGDPEATAEAQRVHEQWREKSPALRRAIWAARMRAQHRTIEKRKQRKRDEYPGRPYSESVAEKADEVPVVDMKASADWLSEGRDDATENKHDTPERAESVNSGERDRDDHSDETDDAND